MGPAYLGGDLVVGFKSCLKLSWMSAILSTIYLGGKKVGEKSSLMHWCRKC